MAATAEESTPPDMATAMGVGWVIGKYQSPGGAVLAVLARPVLRVVGLGGGRKGGAVFAGSGFLVACQGQE